MIRVDETDPVGEIEPAFPYRDVTIRRKNEFKDYYDLQSELGRGKFGTVYLCKEKKSGLKLAAKIVNIIKKEDRRAVEREVEIMRRLQHPRLIQLYDAIDTGKQLYVILELIEGGELFERVIDDDFVLTERSCTVFMRQICEGIEFVHAQNILHLDMKPENILCLTKEGNRIKIIDFGLARQYDSRKKLQVLFGTPEFVAPEVVNFDQIGFGTDMWSIGVICYVLLSGLSPFMGDTDVETMANVTIAKYDFDHEAFANISEDAKDFIRCLLIKDREKRMTASHSRSHRWLTRNNSPKDVHTMKEFDVPLEAESILPISGTFQHLYEKKKNVSSVTKDNMKLFVERWREHPYSPYLLEENFGHLESNSNTESVSLFGESPSPPRSLHNDSCELLKIIEKKDDKLWLTVPSMMLERRASEGDSKKFHNRDPTARIALAEEIINLSEHLRKISPGSQTSVSSGTKISLNGGENDNNEKGCGNIKSLTEYILSNMSNECDTGKSNGIYETMSNIPRCKNMNETAFNDRTNDDIQQSTPGTVSFKTLYSSVNQNRLLNDDLNEGMSQNDRKKSDKLWPSEILDKLFIDDSICREIDLIPPWRKARTKRRFSETCRDVPRISNLQNIHKSLNFDEPTNTKNLLLKLLEEWDEQPSTSMVIGRKFINVDLSVKNIARQSMNSSADYFQCDLKDTHT